MPNWCGNTLTINGPRPELKRFQEENKGTDTILSFEALVPVDECNMHSSCISEWGTKWNAEDPELIYDDGECIKYGFSTANSPPLVWLEKISTKFPTLTFELVYEEGANELYGVFQCSNGDVYDEELEAFDYYSRFNEDFAAELNSINKSSYEDFVNQYSDPDTSYDEYPFTMLDKNVLERIKDKDLPLFITRQWGSYQEDFAKRMGIQP